MNKLERIKAMGGTMPRDGTMVVGSLFLAVSFVIMLLGQLFAFEKMPDLLAKYALFDASIGLLVAAIIVILELAVLPVLLFMPLSKLARMCGWIAGGLAIDIWLLLTAWALLYQLDVQSGVFGAKISLNVDWWTVTFLVSLGIVYLILYTKTFTGTTKKAPKTKRKTTGLPGSTRKK